MDKYLKAELQLAALRDPHRKWAVNGNFVEATACHSGGVSTLKLEPHWARADTPAFYLMVEHRISLCYVDAGVCALLPGESVSRVHAFSDHADERAAVRYAVTCAVIAKLAMERLSQGKAELATLAAAAA